MAFASNNANMGNSINQAAVPEAPRTLASAGSRMETVNERLSKAAEALQMICMQIGAMSPIGQGISAQGTSVPEGAVHRLNDLADDANARLSNIENYIASIQRALG